MEQFGAGMITGWGAHHVDTAHWGMDTELTGPVEIWGHADFPTEGLWNVHGPFKTYGRYANGVVMTISGEFENGIKWIGDKGWIFVCRDTGTTPTASLNAPPVPIVPLRASDPADSRIGDRADRSGTPTHPTTSMETGLTAFIQEKRRWPRPRLGIAPAPLACCIGSS